MAININIPIEDAVTDGSLNPVTSNAVFDALALKANSADLATVATTGDYNDLSNLPSIPSAQVNSDWNATIGVAEILNKPSIPSIAGLVPDTRNLTINGTTYDLSADRSWTIAGGGAIAVGTTAVTSGTVGRVLFEGTGNVVQQDSTLFWDNTNKRLGVGATPSTAVRLDVRAQGALSTDIAFRVRNSANTRDIINVRGNKTIELIADTPATNGGISITASAYNEPIINMYDSFGGKRLIIDTSNALIGVGGSGNIKIGSLTTAISYLGLVTPTTNNRFLKLVDAFSNEYLSIGGNSYDGAGGISLTLKTTTTNGSNFVTFSRINNTNPVVVSDLGYVGIGTATLGARLDVRAQGSAVTDLALRVRNSADTSNLFVVKGNGVLNAANIPTSATGLVTGDIWSNLGILTIV